MRSEFVRLPTALHTCSSGVGGIPDLRVGPLPGGKALLMMHLLALYTLATLMIQVYREEDHNITRNLERRMGLRSVPFSFLFNHR